MNRPPMYTKRPGQFLDNVGSDMLRLTAVTIAEGRDEGSGNHDNTASHDSGLSAPVISEIWDNKEGHNGTNVVHVDEDTKLAFVCVLREKLLPFVHLLGSVDHHTIVSSGGRSNQQENNEEVELAQMRLLVPGNLFESGSLSLGNVKSSLAGVDRRLRGDRLQKLWSRHCELGSIDDVLDNEMAQCMR